ncbi:MAG TPA: Crp/Fnr family transcriptional regulator [Pyrinomonadaceae bacterium]|jgi:CRP-like cAMP-binding protein
MRNPAPVPTIQNRLLAALPEVVYQRLSPHFEAITLEHGAVLYEMEAPIDYFYFPFDAVISLVTQMEDGRIVEVGLVGNEGMTGLAALFGQKVSAERALVQIPNGGTRVKTAVILDEFKQQGELHDACLTYANFFMRQVTQTAACNASHTVEERLARWLLMCRERARGDELNLTQEFIAEMLGTRRATVNVAAVTLQTAGFIKYNRGRIKIIDLAGLEGFACECYEAVKTERASG